MEFIVGLFFVLANISLLFFISFIIARAIKNKTALSMVVAGIVTVAFSIGVWMTSSMLKEISISSRLHESVSRQLVIAIHEYSNKNTVDPYWIDLRNCLDSSDINEMIDKANKFVENH